MSLLWSPIHPYKPQQLLHSVSDLSHYVSTIYASALQVL